MIMIMMVAILCPAGLSEQCSLDDDENDDHDDDADRFYLAPFSVLQSYLNSVHKVRMMMMEVETSELSEQCSLDDDDDFYLALFSALQSYLNR